MKAILIKSVECRNPDFDPEEQLAAVKSHKVYGVKPFVTREPGFEIEDPQAYLLCVPGDLNAPPVAKPGDDECRAAVNAWMDRRPKKLEQIREILKRAPRTKKEKLNHQALREAYGAELGLTQPAKTK